MATRDETPLLHLVDVLEALGVKFALDWDDELQVTYPLVPPTQADLAKIVEHQHPHIVQSLKWARIRRLKVFVGGPLNGRRHGQFSGWPHRRFAVRIARAKWAVYQGTEQPWNDPRLHFLGYATSQAKGRRGVLLPKTETDR